ncbi:endonuclease domain-containing protein [Serratia proteamaculans]|uniref:endonuclease domain-containing protein n=1 Tax=Serratia proteamaculans TaxID=28151 RepID=UPI002981BF6F|nr:DUF559 domain-containing protein [Serratia proteamaculans]MDW5510132.1 DUF559 domain-containing protein [Serratia proteamaculans]
MERKSTPVSRRLRANMSNAEKMVWLQLKDRRFYGLKFRRQFPVGPYFVDFVCWQRKLVIELDGGQHMGQASYDTRRSHFLVSRGFSVLRFWNDEVLNHWDGVAEIIMQYLTVDEGSPHPDPLPQEREKADQGEQNTGWRRIMVPSPKGEG